MTKKTSTPPAAKKAKHAHPHAHGRTDDGNAFLPDPGSGPARTDDDLAEELAEGFLTSATSGEEAGEDAFSGDVPEDDGGPFVETTAKQELAKGVDASNPADAEVAAFPSPMRVVER